VLCGGTHVTNQSCSYPPKNAIQRASDSITVRFIVPQFRNVNGNCMIEPLSHELVDPVFELMKQNMLSYYVSRGEEWNEHKIREHFLAQDGIVVTKSGQVIGFSFYELKEKRLHIHTLQIASTYQNRTIGGRFLKWYRELANKVGAEVITCGVYESNTARYMYERVGFKDIGIVNGVVRMALPLTSTGLGFLTLP